MAGLHALLKDIKPIGGGYHARISDDWRQGRTAYGGLTSGLALAATQMKFPDLPPLRSAQINFIGPVTEDPVITPTLLRRGRNVTSVRTDMHCGDKIVASIMFIFGGPRDSSLSATFAAPDAPAPEDCQPFTPPALKKLVPPFFLKFDTRLISGSRMVSGAADGYIRCWSRHEDADSRSGIVSLLTLGDVLPPAATPTFKTYGPVSSVNWQMNFLSGITTADGWWHVETRQTAARDGYSSQVMRFWNHAGDLVAEGMQSVAIFV